MRSLLILSCFLAETALGWSGVATFKAKGTLPGMSIDGSGISVSGDLPGVMTADLTKIKTGMALRDKHTQEHLETDKHPKAVLTVASMDYGHIKGTLELHGVKKEIQAEGKQDGNKLTATFSIDITEYGIKRPSHLGVGIKDVIDITVELAQ